MQNHSFKKLHDSTVRLPLHAQHCFVPLQKVHTPVLLQNGQASVYEPFCIFSASSDAQPVTRFPVPLQ
jgi:hypothetical protein